MKKAISALVTAILIISTFSSTVYARGCCRGGIYNWQRQYNLCAEEDCEAIGPHIHGDNWYCNANWQGEYAACFIDDCGLFGLNEHDGAFYYCPGYAAGGYGRGWNR